MTDQRMRLAGLKQDLAEREGRSGLKKFGFDSYDDEAEQMKRQIQELENQITLRQRSLASVPPFPIGEGGGLPSMIGAPSLSYSRKGQPIYPSSGLSPISLGGELPTFAQIPPALPATGPFAMVPPPPTDVNVHQDPLQVTTGGVVRIDVNAGPGLSATVGFQGIHTQVNTGTTAPNAGRIATGNMGRGDR